MLKERPGISALVGDGELCIACGFLSFTYATVLISSHEFSHFWSPILFPISPGVDVSEMQELGILQGDGTAQDILDSCMAS